MNNKLEKMDLCMLPYIIATLIIMAVFIIHSIFTPYGWHIITFLFFISALLCFIRYSRRAEPNKHIYSVVLIVCMVGWLFVLFAFENMIETYSTLKYPAVYKAHSECVEYFPEEIPSEASNVKFSARSNCGWGSNFMSLSFNASDEYIADYIDLHKKSEPVSPEMAKMKIRAPFPDEMLNENELDVYLIEYEHHTKLFGVDRNDKRLYIYLWEYSSR